MNARYPDPGILTQLKDKGGFWVPNDLLDHAPKKLKGTGLWIYLTLASRATLDDYPNVDQLIDLCQTTRNKVENVLDTLTDLGYLNLADLLKVRS